MYNSIFITIGSGPTIDFHLRSSTSVRFDWTLLQAGHSGGSFPGEPLLVVNKLKPLNKNLLGKNLNIGCKFGGTGVRWCGNCVAKQRNPKVFRFLDATCWIRAVFSWTTKSNQDVSKPFFNLIHMTRWFLGMSWTTKCCAVDQHPIVNFQERSRRLMLGIYVCMVYVYIYHWDAILRCFFWLGAWPKSFQQTK